jgi:hypothetical protein
MRTIMIVLAAAEQCMTMQLKGGQHFALGWRLYPNKRTRALEQQR